MPEEIELKRITRYPITEDEAYMLNLQLAADLIPFNKLKAKLENERNTYEARIKLLKDCDSEYESLLAKQRAEITQLKEEIERLETIESNYDFMERHS